MKKGQAAMEFLMTYGWAILVVIAAIAALAYFGVLDPARLLPERCQFPAGMDCIDKAAIDGTADTVTIALRNNIGFTTQIDSATASVGSCATTQVDTGSGYVDLPVNVSNNEVFRLRFSGCSLNTGDKFDGQVTVTYTNIESGLQNKAVGDVRGRVA
ncbi:MAG: hypothetical protein QW757_02355 [Candidatus Woesearchaeota archaeon]